jgi:hypothetical protein
MATPATQSQASGAAAQKQVNAWQQNLQMRAAFIKSSIFVKKTLPAVSLVSGTSQYTIPLNNQGGLVGIDLEVTINITNGATATNTANPGAPYNFITNFNFVDQSNVTRHNLSMQGMFDYLNFRQGNGGAPYNASVALAEGGASYGNIVQPLSPNMTVAATNYTVQFLMHIPISKSKTDTMGMVMLQTGNQNQPAVLNLTLSSLTAGAGNGPYPHAWTYQAAAGTIVPHQLYWQPQAGAVPPPIDTGCQWVLFETGPDSTNLTVGLLKQVLFQTQFQTKAIGIRYYNGAAYTFGTDMTSVIEKTLGGTFWVDDDNPTLRFLRFRNMRGFECSPGLYWFDYRQQGGIQYQAVGIYEADFTPSVVNAGAYMTQLYDWLKVPSQLAQLPGGSQIG